MTVTIHANSLKNIKLINRILIAGNYSYKEKKPPIEDDNLTVQEFKSMIKAQKLRIIGKSLQNL